MLFDLCFFLFNSCFSINAIGKYCQDEFTLKMEIKAERVSSFTYEVVNYIQKVVYTI